MTELPTKPLLIFDLDETLIFGTESRLAYSEDFRIGPFYVYCRPHLQTLLQTVAPRFELAIWSSASPDYVSLIAARLATIGVEWSFVWSRERCVQRRDYETHETHYVKDLKKVKRLGYDLDRVLIADDTRHKVVRNYGNAIYVAPFEGDPADEELIQLCRYIMSLHSETNFREIEKRGWRTKQLSR